MRKKIILNIGLLLFFVFPAIYAQVDLPETFSFQLEQLQVDFIQPLERNYKSIRTKKNDFFSCNFGMRSKKEKLEIRYTLQAFNPQKQADHFPEVKAFTMATNLATNSQEAIITNLSIDEKYLQEQFNADWGTVYTFRPKLRFSEKPICQMLALYKEGRGFAYVFFLMDDPNNSALDYRFFALKFKEI